MLSASKAALLGQCGYSFRPEVVRRESSPRAEASRGTLVHAMLESEVRLQPLPKTEDLIALAMFGHIKRWLDRRDREGMLAEVPLAWDPETGRGWGLGGALHSLGMAGHRAYGDPAAWARIAGAAGCPVTAVPMTADIVQGGHVWDLCTGHTDKRAQLELNALALAAALGLDEVTVTTLRVNADGLEEEGTHTFDGFELADLGYRYRDLVRGIPTAEPKPGLHCRDLYCPAVDACPATRAVVAELVPVASLAKKYPFTAEIQSDEHAAQLLPLVKLAEAFLEGVEAALKDRARKRGGIPLGGGKVWAEIFRSVPRFDRALAESLLKQLGATSEQIAALSKMRQESGGFRERKER